jgi:hypothetical protein
MQKVESKAQMHDAKLEKICAKRMGCRVQISRVGRKLIYEIHLWSYKVLSISYLRCKIIKQDSSKSYCPNKIKKTWLVVYRQIQRNITGKI